MSVHHPVPDELLLDYAVGGTGPGKGLLVETHLCMCPESLQRHSLMQSIGGALLDSLDGEPLETLSADGVLARADTLVMPRASAARATARERGRPVVGEGALAGFTLPAPLAPHAREAADPRNWRTLGMGVRAAELSISESGGKVQFLFAKPGTRIFMHTHVGEELVLILNGAYWDSGERWGVGDVAVNDDSSTHAPVIDDAEDCLCLAVTEGPIRFTGFAGLLLNRFNRF